MGSKALTFLLIVLPCAAAEQEKKPPHAPFIRFEDRIKNSDRGKAPEADAMVFPHPVARNIIPGPREVKAGATPVRHPDPDRIIWAVEDKTALHAEYLKKREELLAEKKIQHLLSWCKRNKLETCAEYELRAILSSIRDTRRQDYQNHRSQWHQLAKKRFTEYTFPLPVSGEWTVFPDKTGHHKLSHWAAFAYDLVITKGGRFYRGAGKRLEDHYCWGMPILAQADGVVMRAVDKHADAPAGRSGGYVNCNTVSVYYGAGIQGFYGHLKQGSLKVKAGDRVAKGQELALVGNSGKSVVPHLHFSMMDMSSFSVRGRYCYEVFEKGKWVVVEGEDLKENTRIRNWDPPMK
jgi:hypothetical protein